MNGGGTISFIFALVILYIQQGSHDRFVSTFYVLISRKRAQRIQKMLLYFV